MKLTTTLMKWNSVGVLVLRLAIAVIFFVHGAHKWGMWGMEPSAEMHASMLLIIKILSIAEPLAALAITIGYLTPIATIGLIVDMLGAINLKMNITNTPFMGMPAPGWEFEFMILAGLICLLFVGPGKYSIDGRRPAA
ncbi:MAG TPA: DoxX family protein [Bacteroidota bacterium]|nr:DoxX family protein [Bacteroidota bacterium]